MVTNFDTDQKPNVTLLVNNIITYSILHNNTNMYSILYRFPVIAVLIKLSLLRGAPFNPLIWNEPLSYGLRNLALKTVDIKATQLYGAQDTAVVYIAPFNIT